MEYKFYKNKQVEVLGYIGNDAVICIPGAHYFNEDNEEDELEKLVVSKYELRDCEIITDNAYEEYLKIINQAKQEAIKIKQEATRTINQELSAIKKEIADLEKTRKEVMKDNKTIEVARNLTNGVYKYVVDTSNHLPTIQEFDIWKKVKLDIYKEMSETYNITLNLRRDGVISVYNGYESGRYRMFETLQEAEDFTKEKVNELLCKPGYIQISFIKKAKEMGMDLTKHKQKVNESLEYIKKDKEKYLKGYIDSADRCKTELADIDSYKV